MLSFENAEHGMIEIIVNDSGIGIKEEDQDKLFKLFGSLKSSKELNPEGIGLGLHISKLIVQSFGGHISCKSKYGVGSTFVFTIALDNIQNKIKLL